MIPKNKFVSNNASILQRKRRGNILELLAALSILGPSTMRNCARWVLWQRNLSKHEESTDKEIKGKVRDYLRLIKGRTEDSGRYSGLIERGYLYKIGKIQGENRSIPVDVYFLTLRGVILSLGYDFDSSQWKQFIKNASYGSLFFSYLNKILEETSSFSLVQKLFLKPIQDLIGRNKIDVNDRKAESADELVFNFSMMAERIGSSLPQIIKDISNKIDESMGPQIKSFLKDDKDVETLMKNTWFDEDMLAWSTEALEYFYPHHVERNFYDHFSDKENDMILTYEVMKQICIWYYMTKQLIPQKHPSIPPLSTPEKLQSASEFENYLEKEINTCDTCMFLQELEKTP